MSLQPAAPPPTRDLWLIRLYYFTWLGGGGILSPFISLFYIQQNLHGTEIGLLGTVGSLMALVAAPLWGRWSDNVAKPRRLIQLGLSGSAICMLLLSQQSLFLVMAVIIGIEALISAGVDPISNMQVIAITCGDDKAGFGSVRLWGSLGWALLAPLGGWLIERTSLFTPFLGYAVFMAISIVVLAFIRSQPRAAVQENEPPRPTWRGVVGGLLHNRAMLGLAIVIVLTGLCMSGTYRFEAIYLNQMGARDTLIGLMNTVGALIELPAMLLADRLMKRFGAGRVLLASFLLHAVSMLFVLVYPSIPVMFMMRFLRGIAYGLEVVATIAFIVEHTPHQQQSTVLAIYSMTLVCLVGIVAGPLSGLVFDLAGAYWLYAIALVGNLVSALVLRLTAPPRESTAARPANIHPPGHSGE